MGRYKLGERDQVQFLTVDFNSQITKNSFEWHLDHIVENKLDMSDFDSDFKNDKTGSPAYDPRVLLKIIFYAYSLGIVHSRKIEQACRTNIKFMALTGNLTPDHTTLTRFVSSMGLKSVKVFSQIVLLCDHLGLIGKNMFAIDGCKISSNASKEWSGKLEDFKKRKLKTEKEVKKILKKHQELDDNIEEQKIQIEKEQEAIKHLNARIEKFQKFIDKNEDRISHAGNKILPKGHTSEVTLSKA